MTIKRVVRGLGAAAFLAAVGCNTLDVTNPNEPDATRALADPNAIEAIAGGAMRTWFNAFTDLRGAGVLSTQARAYASSWNNGNLNFYSSIDNPTAPPDQWNRQSRSWQNDPSAGARTSIDAFWGGGLDESSASRGGFYTSLSSANSALTAIRKNGTVIGSAAGTKRAETFAALMQGASLMMLALQYDKAYIVDENSDVSTLEYSNRKIVRDSAVSKLQQAATLAAANTFTTPTDWTNGFAYTNVEIAKIANTMSAMTLAYWPRDPSEVAGVPWAQVATYASKGMSSGTPVDLQFVQDGYSAWISELMNWFDGIDGGRVHTRVAHFLDPATQKDPWPLTGNPRPHSADKRLGDGSYGNEGTAESFGTLPSSGSGGTDFAWSATAIMRPDRGSYHQSNIAQVRYDYTRTMDASGTYLGYGPAPAINATVNDLIWAEALLRQGASNAAAAAALIDKSRVVRGGLPTSATNAGVGSDADGPCMSTGVKAKDGTPCTLWSMLLYEDELELLGLGPTPFWEQRHLPIVIGGGYSGDNSPRRYIQGLLPGTPREMPVPYKELGVKGEPLYTWGGATPNSPTPP
jgi:hypothetical protein